MHRRITIVTITKSAHETGKIASEIAIDKLSPEKIIKMKLSYSSAVEQKETFHLTKRFDKVQRSKNNFFK